MVKCPNCGTELEGDVLIHGEMSATGVAEIKGNTIDSNVNWEEFRDSTDEVVECEACGNIFTIDDLGLKWA